MPEQTPKQRLAAYWARALPGDRYGRSTSRPEYFEEIAEARYRLEPYIPEFAGFARAQGFQVLEIGVGTGQDFTSWVTGGAEAVGLDLTQTAATTTREALTVAGKWSKVQGLAVADAENLPFKDGVFDIVYAWGVLHHSPDTSRAIKQSWRVLKPGGEFRFMVYHALSWTVLFLWVRWALLCGRPFMSAQTCAYRHLESPGTKVYRVADLAGLLAEAGFGAIKISTRLGPSDLLSISPSSRYQNLIYRIIRKLYPQWIVRMFGDRFGLYMMAKATKSTA